MCKQSLKLKPHTANRMQDFLGEQIDQSTTFFLNKLKYDVTNLNEESDVLLEDDNISKNTKQFALIKNSILNEDKTKVKQLLEVNM
jgi:hypothetical protein